MCALIITNITLTPPSGTFIPGSGILVSMSGNVSGGTPGTQYKWEWYYGDNTYSPSISGIDKVCDVTSKYYNEYIYRYIWLTVYNNGTYASSGVTFFIYSYPSISVTGGVLSGETPFTTTIIPIVSSGAWPMTYIFYPEGILGSGIKTTTSYLSYTYLRSNTYDAMVVARDSFGTEVSGSVQLISYKPSKLTQIAQAEEYSRKMLVATEDFCKCIKRLRTGLMNTLEKSGMYQEDFYATYNPASIVALSLGSEYKKMHDCLEYMVDNNPSGKY